MSTATNHIVTADIRSLGVKVAMNGGTREILATGGEKIARDFVVQSLQGSWELVDAVKTSRHAAAVEVLAALLDAAGFAGVPVEVSSEMPAEDEFPTEA